MKNKSIIYIIYSIYSYVFNFSFYFLPLYLKDINLNGSQIGILFMCFSITAMMFSFNIGMLIDRIGAKTNLFIGFIFLSMFYGGLFVANEYYIYILIFLIGGIGNSILKVSINSVFLKLIYNQHRNEEIGRFNFYYYLALVSGIFTGGLMLNKIGFHKVFLLSVFMSFSILLLVYKITNIKITLTKTGEYIADLHSKKVLMFLGLVFIFCTHWGAENTLYVLFLTKNLNLTYIQSGFFIGLPILFLGISNYYFGKKKYSEYRLFFYGVLASGLGLIAFVCFDNVYLSLLCRIIHEIGDGAFNMFYYLLLVKLFKSDRIGGNTGAATVVMILGQSFGSLFYGVLSDVYGYVIPHIVAGIITLMVVFFGKYIQKV